MLNVKVLYFWINMGHPISEFEKARREHLGKYLKELRVNCEFKQKKISEEFGVNLNEIEKGNRPVDDDLLFNLSKKYDTPLEDILERNHWPQLRLLSCIIRPTEVKADLLSEIESGLTSQEIEDITEELKRYKAFLLLSKQISNHSET